MGVRTYFLTSLTELNEQMPGSLLLKNIFYLIIVTLKCFFLFIACETHHHLIDIPNNIKIILPKTI